MSCQMTHFSTISNKVPVIHDNIWCLRLKKIDYVIEVSHKPLLRRFVHQLNLIWKIKNKLAQRLNKKIIPALYNAIVAELRRDQPCISCGEFITTLSRKSIIYTFGKTMFAITNVLAYVKNTDQNFTDQSFHPILLFFPLSYMSETLH